MGAVYPLSVLLNMDRFSLWPCYGLSASKSTTDGDNGLHTILTVLISPQMNCSMSSAHERNVYCYGSKKFLENVYV